MNCAIAVLKRLQKKYGWELEETIKNCEAKLTDKGMNFYDLLCECQKVKPCVGVASLKLIQKTPYIAYISLVAGGHYVLVEKVDKKVTVYDNNYGQREVNKFLFWLVWSKKAIVFHECL